MYNGKEVDLKIDDKVVGKIKIDQVSGWNFKFALPKETVNELSNLLNGR